MSRKINIIIVGAGMYACGRGTEGYGTILPALNQGIKDGKVGEIHIAATSPQSIQIAKDKLVGLNKLMATNTQFSGVYPSDEKPDKNSYINAIKTTPEPRCAIISVPDHLHFDIAKFFIESKIPILVVKPLTPTLQETFDLIELQKKYCVYGMVEFHKRFDEANLLIKNELSKGTVGDVLYINVEYSQRKIIPEKVFKSWVTRTNIFQYLGVHYVDLIYFFLKAKPIRVLATGQKRWLVSKGINTYDSIQVLIEWYDSNKEYSFISSHLTNWIDPDSTSAMSDQKLKIIGTQGRIDSDQKNRGLQVVTDSSGIEDVNPYFSKHFLDYNGQGYSFRGYGAKSIEQFVEDVRRVKEESIEYTEIDDMRPTFSDCIYSTAVTEAATKSLEDGSRWVETNI